LYSLEKIRLQQAFPSFWRFFLGFKAPGFFQEFAANVETIVGANFLSMYFSQCTV
jgi:hypothetical protein